MRSFVLAFPLLLAQVVGQTPLPALPNWAASNPIHLPANPSSHWDLVPLEYKVGHGDRGGIRSDPGVRARFHSASGDIAIYGPGGFTAGVPTGFSDLLFVDFCDTPAHAAAGAKRSLIWSGSQTNGPFGVGFLPIPDGGIATAELARLEVLPTAASAGDVWLACGSAAGAVYYVDVTGNLVRRYVPLNGSLAHDPGFSVSLPVGSRGILRISEPLPHVPGPANAVAFLDGNYGGGGEPLSYNYIVPANPGFGLFSEPNPKLPSTQIQLRQSFVAGISTVAIQGPAGHSVWVEAAPTATGPWTRIGSKHASVASRDFLVYPLSSPLIEGQYIRVQDGTISSPGKPLRIPPAKATIHGIKGLKLGKALGGDILHVHGGGWPMNLAVSFQEIQPSTGNLVDHTLTPTNLTPDSFSVALPNVSAGGWLRIMGNGATLTYKLTIKQ